MSGNKRPSLVVGALILDPENKILLISQPKWKNKFTIPGGHVDWGEKLQDAVEREVLEETGIKIKGIKFFNLSEYVLGDENMAEKHHIFIDYICVTDEKEISLNKEANKYKWIEPNKALELPLTSNTRQVIQKYVDSKQ